MLDAANGIGKEDTWRATTSRQPRLSLFKGLAERIPAITQLGSASLALWRKVLADVGLTGIDGAIVVRVVAGYCDGDGYDHGTFAVPSVTAVCPSDGLSRWMCPQ